MLTKVPISTSPSSQDRLIQDAKDKHILGWRDRGGHDKDKFMKSIIRLIASIGLLALVGCATQSNQGGMPDDQSQTTYDSGSSYPPAHLGDGP
jgi:hypothetical protein